MRGASGWGALTPRRAARRTGTELLEAHVLNMILFHDVDRSGDISLEEFKSLWSLGIRQDESSGAGSLFVCFFCWV